jgi:hypothetical protein
MHCLRALPTMPDGSVRQIAERSTDGATWSTAIDLHDVRRRSHGPAQERSRDPPGAGGAAAARA